MSTKNSNLDPYESLANAIILQAVKDYRVALKKLRKNPRNQLALSEKQEIESFFYSRRFSVLTNVDPQIIVDGLQREVAV